jgi:hypothetical protein
MREALGLCLCAALAATTDVSAAAGLRNENVLTPVPTGYKVGYSASQGALTMAEYIPVRETVEDWSTMITVQIFRGQGRRDPDAFADNLGARWKASCPDATSVPVTHGMENGYPFSVWSYECPHNPATRKPESMWLKAISGSDSLYAVQYANRTSMSPALIRPAMIYLKEVKVCDTRRPDRPCPAGM